jgi:hypothetical protein
MLPIVAILVILAIIYFLSFAAKKKTKDEELGEHR